MSPPIWGGPGLGSQPHYQLRVDTFIIVCVLVKVPPKPRT